MMPQLENSTAPKLYLMHKIIKKYRIRPPLGYVYEAYMKHMDFAFLDFNSKMPHYIHTNWRHF